MSASAWGQLALLVVALAVSIPLLGGYMAKVYGSDKAPGDRVFLPIERLIYRICRVDPDQEQRWTVYAFSVIAFSVVGLLILYAMQRLQASLPLDPTHAPQVGEALSFNTATSFTSNTNWQSYARRVDAQLPHADGRPHGAELRLRCCGHGRDGRAHPRARPATRRTPSGTSGSTSRARRCVSCCRSHSSAP